MQKAIKTTLFEVTVGFSSSHNLGKSIIQSGKTYVAANSFNEAIAAPEKLAYGITGSLVYTAWITGAVEVGGVVCFVDTPE